MTEASLRKILNGGERKFSEAELKVVITMLRRLADIEHGNHLIIKQINK